jgi:hypothetical protein
MPKDHDSPNMSTVTTLSPEMARDQTSLMAAAYMGRMRPPSKWLRTVRTSHPTIAAMNNVVATLRNIADIARRSQQKRHDEAKRYSILPAFWPNKG